MSKTPAIPANTTLARISSATTPKERAELQYTAMEPIEDPRFPRKLPRFLTELPYGGNSDEITDRIASAVLVAEDPDAAQASQGTTATKTMVGRSVTVWEIIAMPSNQDGGWGAYLLLDVTVDDDPAHLVVNTGAKQVVSRLARAWADGALPIRGTFAAIDGTGSKGNPALAFMADGPEL